MRLIDRGEVKRLLPMGRCMEVVSRALAELALGKGQNPLRTVMWLPDRRGALGLMPASLDDPAMMGIKVISVFPGNHGTPFESHQGVVLLFEVEHGRLIAQLDGSEITGIRTAAASGVATRLLARESIEEVAILGTGAQASSHLEAMIAVRKIRKVRVWSRDRENVRRFSLLASEKYGLEVRGVDSVKEAVRGVRLICTTTSAVDPILCGRWVSPGAHINAVGACFPAARELDTELVVGSSLFVDRMESALNESGDFLIPKNEGAIGEDHIRGEIGELVLEKIPGRGSEDEITIFKSLGIGVEDLICADYVYRRAVEEGLGVEVDLA